MKTHANVSPSLNRDFSGKNWANQRGVAFRGAPEDEVIRGARCFFLKTPRCLSFDDFLKTASQCQQPFYQFQIISGFKASNPFQQCSDASLSLVPINSGSKDPGLFSVSLRKSDTLSSPQDLSINWFTLVKKQMCVCINTKIHTRERMKCISNHISSG